MRENDIRIMKSSNGRLIVKLTLNISGCLCFLILPSNFVDVQNWSLCFLLVAGHILDGVSDSSSS